ncbi:hypothetical protein BDV93DRAFT_65234 [Ceratobasidium sp. AG-I]|nr:hypothetical protein BDV93DRAFT_65234 [Ceratobasidium sp. AG-I]
MLIQYRLAQCRYCQQLFARRARPCACGSYFPVPSTPAHAQYFKCVRCEPLVMYDVGSSYACNRCSSLPSRLLSNEACCAFFRAYVEQHLCQYGSNESFEVRCFIDSVHIVPIV